MLRLGPNKEELREQVGRVTVQTHELQVRVQDLRSLFTELEPIHEEARGCCFPFSYIMLRDVVNDVNERASWLQQKWDHPDCQHSLQTLKRFSDILEDLKGLKYKGLEKALAERQTSLAQQKVVFNQMQDLLKQLQDLHAQAQETWLCPRYLMLRRGVHSTLAAFSSVAGLSESTGQSSSDNGQSVVHNYRNGTSPKTNR